MPKAISVSTTPAPSRRSLLAAGPLAAIAAAMPSITLGQVQGEQELIALCAEFDALERKSIESGCDVAGEQAALAERIIATPPQTLEGFRALARSIVLWAPDMLDNSAGELGGLHGDLNSAMLRALTGGVA